MRFNHWVVLMAAGCAGAAAWTRAEEPEVPKTATLSIVEPQAGGRFQGPNITPWGFVQRESGQYLGVSASAAPEVLSHQLRVTPGTGLVVDQVIPDSPAAKAGLQQFDLLVKLDDQILVNSEQFATLVRTHKAGDEITLSIIREGKPQSLTAKLAERRPEPHALLFNGALPGSAEEHRERGQREGEGHEAPVRFRLGGYEARNGQERTATTEVWKDGDITLTVKTNDGHKTLTATDAKGRELFKGPIDTADQRQGIPSDVREKLENRKSPYLDNGNREPGSGKSEGRRTKDPNNQDEDEK